MAEDYIVRGKSRIDIEKVALDFLMKHERSSLEVDSDSLDVEKTLDRTMYTELGYSISVEFDDEMPSHIEAMTSFANRVIEIRESDYERLNEPCRSRFTACHEIGHALLHTDQLKDVSVEESKTLKLCRQKNDIPPYARADWQADVFASALLMPASTSIQLYKQMVIDGWVELMIIQAFCKRFKVSFEAAKVRVMVVKNYISKGEDQDFINYIKEKDSVIRVTKSL